MSGTDPTYPSGIPTSTVIDVPTFRLHRPEFASAATYPDVVVQMNLDAGSVACAPRVWGNMRQMAVELFTCHMLAMGQYAARAGAGAGPGAPGIPGGQVGVMTSKSVSKVSVGYDTSSTTIEGGGPWNMTPYGQMWLWYAQLAGTGGYETLGVGWDTSLEGLVWTWQRGVMARWGS